MDAIVKIMLAVALSIASKIDSLMHVCAWQVKLLGDDRTWWYDSAALKKVRASPPMEMKQ